MNLIMENPYDLSQFITMQQTLLNSLKPVLEMLGLSMEVDRIVLKPNDCESEKGNLCIDYVWRIKCQDQFICNKLREQIKAGANV